MRGRRGSRFMRRRRKKKKRGREGGEETEKRRMRAMVASLHAGSGSFLPARWFQFFSFSFLVIFVHSSLTQALVSFSALLHLYLPVLYLFGSPHPSFTSYHASSSTFVRSFVLCCNMCMLRRMYIVVYEYRY
ncbi:hypothetical protein DFH09DRAFT_1192533 [Mycena vulgaris]|nr:hypothetical protein DFH09DRAFT_1192533 [Mycena vulgaris]